MGGDHGNDVLVLADQRGSELIRCFATCRTGIVSKQANPHPKQVGCSVGTVVLRHTWRTLGSGTSLCIRGQLGIFAHEHSSKPAFSAFGFFFGGEFAWVPSASISHMEPICWFPFQLVRGVSSSARHRPAPERRRRCGGCISSTSATPAWPLPCVQRAASKAEGTEVAVGTTFRVF